MEQYIGEIQLFAFTFAPNGWAFCNGQFLPINQNQALFSLLGTTYGGNGINTFALPNLQGRSMIHPGSSSGTSNYALGQVGGVNTVTLTQGNIPVHTHTVTVGVNTSPGNNSVPTNRLASRPNAFTEDALPGNLLGGVTSGTVGQSIPVNIVNPILGINHCIALVGIFPSRP